MLKCWNGGKATAKPWNVISVNCGNKIWKFENVEMVAKPRQSHENVEILDCFVKNKKKIVVFNHQSENRKILTFQNLKSYKMLSR